MLQRNTMIARLIQTFALALALTGAAHAKSIRLDAGGDWDLVFSGNSSTTSSVGTGIGFDVDFFGVTGNFATVDSEGRLTISGGSGLANLDPLFDPDQTAGGNNVQYSIETTNGFFTQAGIEDGYRATWSMFDAAGALRNQYQVAMFALTGGQFVVEFNYDAITFGDDATGIGFSTSLGGSFDLPGSLGLLRACLQQFLLRHDGLRTERDDPARYRRRLLPAGSGLRRAGPGALSLPDRCGRRRGASDDRFDRAWPPRPAARIPAPGAPGRKLTP